MTVHAGGADGGAPSFVDPRAVVERVLEYRAAVAAQWIEKLADVPEQILALRREHLSRRVGI